MRYIIPDLVWPPGESLSVWWKIYNFLRLPWAAPTEEYYARGDNNSAKQQSSWTKYGQTCRATGLRRRVGRCKERAQDAAQISSRYGQGGRYDKVLSKAKRNVSLQELGIRNTKIGRAFNGGLIIEVPGKDGAELASILRDRLTEVLGAEIKVDRPVAKGEIRITGIDPSMTQDEISLELINKWLPAHGIKGQ